MKLYRLMVSILCMALLMVLWGCFPCVAEILVRDGHVTGGKGVVRQRQLSMCKPKAAVHG